MTDAGDLQVCLRTADLKEDVIDHGGIRFHQVAKEGLVEDTYQGEIGA